MRIKQTPAYIIDTLLAREQRYAKLKPKPNPMTAFWHDGAYNGMYQIIIPTQKEIALITKSSVPLEHELLEELRKQDPRRLELQVEQEAPWKDHPVMIMQLLLEQKKLIKLTPEQHYIARRLLEETDFVNINIPIGLNARDN